MNQLFWLALIVFIPIGINSYLFYKDQIREIDRKMAAKTNAKCKHCGTRVFIKMKVFPWTCPECKKRNEPYE